MKMEPCPKCGAPNSVKREGCFNCGTALVGDVPPEVVTEALPADRVPLSSILIGVFAGILALPFGLAFLASRFKHRRIYGKGLCIGFGIQAAVGIALVWLIQGFTANAGAVPAATATQPRAIAVYDAVATGMSESEVLNVCGPPDQIQESDIGPIYAGSVSVGPTHSEYWTYQTVRIIVGFENGVVVSKSSF
jgi:hypothetical protein